MQAGDKKTRSLTRSWQSCSERRTTDVNDYMIMRESATSLFTTNSTTETDELQPSAAAAATTTVASKSPISAVAAGPCRPQRAPRRRIATTPARSTRCPMPLQRPFDVLRRRWRGQVANRRDGDTIAEGNSTDTCRELLKTFFC
jgi:hypothetical protein